MKNLLKKVSLLIVGVSFMSLAHGTVHRVTVQNHVFTPASFTAVVGDTVKWVWLNGTHTTTETSMPTGATSWTAPIDNSSTADTAFEYKITTAGTYGYECIYHASMGMVATFTVTVPAGVANVASTKEVAQIFPNPVSNMLNIHLNANPNNNVLIITDIIGKEVMRETLSSIDNAIDVSAWKRGIYLYHLENNGQTMEGKLEVQ